MQHSTLTFSELIDFFLLSQTISLIFHDKLELHPVLHCVAASPKLVSCPCLINSIHYIIHLVNEITE